jgi:hypothetical protein
MPFASPAPADSHPPSPIFIDMKPRLAAIAITLALDSLCRDKELGRNRTELAEVG